MAIAQLTVNTGSGETTSNECLLPSPTGITVSAGAGWIRIESGKPFSAELFTIKHGRSLV